jgi:hypothetical protein
MSLIPDDTLASLQRLLVAAIWGIGTLLLGVLVIVLIELLFQVSGHTSLGLWGGAGVLLLAGAAAFLAWRRYGRKSQGRPPRGVEAWRDRKSVVVPPPPVPTKQAGKRTPPPAQRPSPPLPTAGGTPDVTEAKRRFHTAIEAGQLDRAEQIVAEIEAVPDERQWCANARRRIQFARDRRS